MKLLITGGAGFVGSNLAIKFKQQYPNYTVTVLDNLKRRGSELNLTRLRENDIVFQHGDIRNKEDLFFDDGFDMIIDASAEPSVLAGITSPVGQVVNNNLVGTLNCLELAKQYNAGFIFLSTSRVYPIAAIEAADFTEEATRFSWTDNQKLPGISSKGITEHFPLSGSRSFYGATKLASELMIQEYVELAGLKAVINRCGVLTGPWQMGKVDQGVMVLWIARHIFKGKLGYFGYGGTGKQVRDVLHVDDLYRLVDWQVHNIDKVNGEILNAGGGVQTSVSLQELTGLCQQATGNKIEIGSVPENRVADLRIYITDNTYVTGKTGWTPQIGMERIVDDITKWIIENQKDLQHILN